MRPGIDFDTDLENVNGVRKTVLIDRELHRLKVDVCALQETRLPDTGQIKETNYTFFWHGLSTEDRRIHGVGFAVRNPISNLVNTPIAISERIMVLEIPAKPFNIVLISAYAPTLTSSEENKDKFYETLQNTINDINTSNPVYVLGDFNARVGALGHAWPTCLGNFGIGKLNENGQRLLEFASLKSLCVTNTFFKQRDKRKVSWRHPRSGHWHQIDLILTRRTHLNTVKTTRSYQSADCDTDHSLVLCKVKVCLKSHVMKNKSEKRQKINTSNTKNPGRQNLFAENLRYTLEDTPIGSTTNASWKTLSSAIHESAVKAFGTGTVSNKDWIEQNKDTLFPIIEKKKEAYIMYKNDPSEGNKMKLQNAKRLVQKESRRCANQYWIDLCTDIQKASNSSDLRSMYAGIKKATGPPVVKAVPLKDKNGDPIHDKKGQLRRWVEHYSLLYSEEREIEADLQNLIKRSPIVEELDAEPTAEEVLVALKALTSGKAPGPDCIPPEVLRDNKSTLTPHLHTLLIQCWREKCLPHDMRIAKIVTLYKNKGDRSSCDNYRGISLLNVTGKVFARVILKRLQKLAESVYPESQCGFRSGRATTDMIFSLRQLQEKCREQNKPLYVAFVDLEKAFDTVSRSGLQEILNIIGCPPTLLALIMSLHTDTHATVQYAGKTSNNFQIRCGVRQGCVLAPTLFGIFFSILINYAFTTIPGDIYLHYRTDGSLYNLARLRAKTRVKKTMIKELLFADDAAFVAHSEQVLQNLMDNFSRTCKMFSLTISLRKTVVFGQGILDKPNITLGYTSLMTVDNFCYLGSTVSTDLSLNEELNIRIGKAARVFAKLTKRVFENPKLVIRTKVAVYQSCVLSTLIYGSETWTTYSSQMRKLSTFHMRCLRRILCVKWQDRVSNVDVLNRAKIHSLPAIVHKRRLRWLGHVSRMEDGRIPKQLLFGELAEAQRSRGRPKLRFKDVCKNSMVKLRIPIQSWESMSADRKLWRQQLRTGTAAFEEKCKEDYHQRREARSQISGSTLLPRSGPTQANQRTFICSMCARVCLSRIGLFSHERSCGRRRTE